MDYFSEIWQKFIHLFAIPNTIIFLSILALSYFWYFVSLHRAELRLLATLTFLSLAVWYFGVFPTVQLLIIMASSFLVAYSVFKIKDYFLAFVVGFLSYLQILAIFVVIFNFSLGYYLTLATFVIISVLCRPKWASIKISFPKLNPLDWAFILAAILFGSVPQSHWDAVYANLYISKWYMLSNSLAPMKEAVTSLFPQGATLYYALFYKIGGLKMLQIAYLLPSLLIILFLKTIFSQTKLKLFGKIIVYACIMTPIFLFQATNGYYDNLVLLLLLAASYSLFFLEFGTILKKCLIAAFLIGFASSVKYFPLVMIPIIIFQYVSSLKKLTFKNLLPVIAIVVLSIAPLTVWMLRTYSYTGSPIYPFFQQYFPTPNHWYPGDPLEANPMIQTTMSVSNWVSGGFLKYPVVSYLKSADFIEGTKGYPSIIYVVILPLQIFLLFVSAFNSFKRRQRSNDEKFFIASFLMYFAVGLVVRYYRYLWPFQFLWLLASVIRLSTMIKGRRALALAMTTLVLCALPLQFINFIEYYRYYPLDVQKIFKPDYYLTATPVKTPISYINSLAKPADFVLDASQAFLPRIHLVPKVYQCNWYWIRWADDIKDPSVLEQFKYIVGTDPVTKSSNYCSSVVQRAVIEGLYRLVYQDGVSTVYEKTK